jgi:cobyrinic acid a,c-diamide synthase
LNIPVLAVLDASAMAQTAGAIVHGLRDYGPVDLAGVIANRVASPGHAAMVAASLRGVPLFGTLPRQARALPERHLGLVQPAEIDGIDGLLDQLAQQLDFDEAAWNSLRTSRIAPGAPIADVAPLLAGKTIAIARDAAFAFIYPANLHVLAQMGARVAWFSPLAGDAIPAHADAIYLPGGYPELHADTLANTHAWQDSLRAAHAAGIPIVAECGGMMALADALVDIAGARWPMAGLLPGTASMQARLAGLGPQGLATAHGQLRGHTFHYSKLDTTVPANACTIKNPSGVQGEAVYRQGSLTASYFHAWFPSCPQAVAALFTRGGA